MGVRGAYRVAAAAALLAVTGAAPASLNGITGQSVAGCTGCHGTTFNYTTSINGGASTVAPSSATSFTVQMNGAGAAAAGFNMSVINNGSLAAGVDGGAGASIPKLVGGELTHSAPRAGAAPSWTIRFNAGASVGTATLRVCGNPVNNTGTSAGDGSSNAGVCTTRAITVNRSPTATIDSRTVLEDSGGTAFSLMSNDFSGTGANDGGDSISITNVTNPAGGTATITGGGTTVTYTPDANFSGADSFIYTITDSIGATDTATVSVTVTDVNDAPTLNAIVNPAAINEDAAQQTVNLSGIGDGSTFETQTLAVTASSGNTGLIPNPTVTYTSPNATGSLAYTPVGNANGSAVITVTVTDSGGVANGGVNSIQRTFTVNVTAANDAPVAVDDGATVDEDSSLNVLPVLTNDTDVDSGDTKTVTLVNGAGVSTCPTMTAVTNGSVCKSSSSANNTLSFTPTPAFVGATSFTYTMQDTATAADTATVSITISNVGDAPVAVDDTATVNEDSSGNVLDVLANDTDVDAGDTKTITQVNGGAVATCPSATAITNGTVCRSSVNPNNTLTLTPTANFAGNISFNYTVQDSATLTDIGAVSITVTNINDTPVAVADSQSISEDAAPATVNVLANDTDADSGDTRTITQVNGATVATCPATTALTNGTVCRSSASANNTLSYDSAPDFFGSEMFSYTMQDSTGLTASATVTITVTAVNDAPQITSSAITTAQDGVLYSYQVTVSDVDDLNNGVQLAWSLPTSPAGMTVSTTGLIQWTPPINTSGGFNVTVQVADGGENGAAPATQSFTINVSIPDTDGDLMPDSFENLYGLDPNDPSDANEDTDGDGLSNLEEYQNGSDPTRDDIPPAVTAPADLVVPSTGYLTFVDLGAASAVDGKDGVLTPTSDWTLPVVRPGRHPVTWSATDLAGNTGTDTQQVDVLPQVIITGEDISGEGRSPNIYIVLSGTPPQYPVDIPYTLTGTASAGDTNLVAGTFTLNSPNQSLVVPITVIDDGVPESDETLTFTLTGASNATLGLTVVHTLTLTDANAPPQGLEIVGFQTFVNRFVGFKGSGPLTLDMRGYDPNGDSLTFDWSASDAALPIDDPTSSLPMVDLTNVDPGIYVVRLTVDDGNGGTASASRLLRVVDGASSIRDFDDDGILDDFESSLDYPARLDNQTGDPASVELLETDMGYVLRRGRTSIAADRTGALIVMSDIVNFGIGEGALPVIGADSYDNVGGIFDFEIHYVAPGGTARVVLPLQTAILEGSVYRKFDPASGWHDFVVDVSNAVASAHSTFGLCPGPASTEYADGLQPFDDCVRLTLQDGGPNDADGVADGVIRDPGGVAASSTTPSPPSNPVSNGAFLALWLPLALLLRLRRRAGLAVLALVALLSAAPAGAEHHIRIHYTGDLVSGFDDNVTNAQYGADIRESGFASAAGNVDYFRALSLYTTLQLRGSAQAEYWNSFDGLNNAKATGMARVLYKANGNFYTPTLAAWVSASLWEFDSAIRDSNEYRFGVFATEQITTQITARLALTANQREADGLVYDLSGASASVNVDWVPAPRSTVYMGYQYYNGGVASTATPSLAISLAKEAVEPDDAFGGFAGGLMAYRLDATAQIATLGYNFAITRKLSADLQGQHISTTADFGNEYQRTVAVISLLARF